MIAIEARWGKRREWNPEVLKLPQDIVYIAVAFSRRPTVWIGVDLGSWVKIVPVYKDSEGYTSLRKAIHLPLERAKVEMEDKDAIIITTEQVEAIMTPSQLTIKVKG